MHYYILIPNKYTLKDKARFLIIIQIIFEPITKQNWLRT